MFVFLEAATVQVWSGAAMQKREGSLQGEAVSRQPESGIVFARFWNACWDASTPVQVAFHRGIWSNFQAVPEDSMSAVLAALQFGNIVEVDVVLTKDGSIIAAHDFNAHRTMALGDRRWSELILGEVEGILLIVRDVSGYHFTTTYTVTNDSVVTLESLLKTVFATNERCQCPLVLKLAVFEARTP